MTKFKFSVGPWNVHSGADSYGPATRDEIAFEEKIRTFAELGFSAIQFHDDDAVPNINDYTEEEIKEKARTLKKMLDKYGLAAEFVAPRLWMDGRTADGGFMSTSEEDREYAMWRAYRSIDIAKELGCNMVVLWLAREGTLCAESKSPVWATKMLIQAINKMLEYVHEYNTKKWLDEIDAWKSEHPLMMKKKPYLTPQYIIETINRVFEELIVVTDVGQHQMFTAQFIELTNKKKLLMSGGLGTMGYGLPGAIGAKIGNPDTPVLSISGDGGMQMNIQEIATAVLEELPIINCIFNNNNLGMVRQWQKLFYGKRYAMTCLRAGAACRNKCGEVSCPTYTPDFVKLAESYGAKGIRVTEKEQIEPALREAMSSKKTPVIIEFIINPEDLVYPMIQPNGTLKDMLMDC